MTSGENKQNILLTRESLAGLDIHECAFTIKPSTKLLQDEKAKLFMRRFDYEDEEE